LHPLSISIARARCAAAPLMSYALAAPGHQEKML
jgi:hypothetical protein